MRDTSPKPRDRSKWVSRNRAHVLRYQRKWRAANKSKCKGYSDKYRLANPEKYKNQKRQKRLKRKYGLTLAAFDAMLAKQDYKCKSCSENITSNGHVDHCHKTGKVRAILCAECNIGLGMMRENPKKIAALAKYAESISLSSFSSGEKEERES